MAAVHQIGGYRVTDRVLDAVRTASAETGVDFGYMMAKAARESGFDADVRASTSSATGLYQFVDQTWLGMVKAHGPDHGLGRYADRIETRVDGRFTVADPDLRREILELRTDPRLNALMAAEYARDNQAHLERTVGGTIGPTELYLAHFLGAGGAETFIEAMRADPDAPAAALLPAAASANRSVFYKADGTPRSLREIHAAVAGSVQRDMALADLAPDTAPTPAPSRSLFEPSAKTRVAGLTVPANPGGIGGNYSAAMPAGLAGAGGRQLSLWTVLTLSSMAVPGDDGDDGVSAAKALRPAGTLFG